MIVIKELSAVILREPWHDQKDTYCGKRQRDYHEDNESCKAQFFLASLRNVKLVLGAVDPYCQLKRDPVLDYTDIELGKLLYEV